MSNPPISNAASQPTGTRQLSIRRLLSGRGSQSGQAGLEMAVALPVFLLLVFGIAQCSFLLMTYCNATYVCRNAARYASVHSNTSLAKSKDSDIVSMVQSGMILSSTITPNITVSYLDSNLGVGTNDIGNYVSVQVSWSQSLVIPFASGAQTFTVRTQTTRPIVR